MLKVYAIKSLDQDAFLNFEKDIRPLFPAETLEKLERKKGISRQNSWLGEALSRYVIAQNRKIDARSISFSNNQNGKPIIKNPVGLYHNLSHSGVWVVAAISNNDVGIDIERIRTGKMKIAERYFTDSEYKTLLEIDDEKKANDYFFELWTMKESYLKAIGTGLTKWLNTFSVQRNNDGKHVILDKNYDADFYLHQYEIDSHYKMVVCTKEKKVKNEVEIVTSKDLKDYIFSLEAFKI